MTKSKTAVNTTKEQTESTDVSKAVGSLNNLLSYLTTSVNFAESRVLTILVELHIKFDFFNITTSNAKAVIEDEKFKKANKAFNRERMAAFAEKLLGDRQRLQLAILDWDSKGNEKPTCLVGNVYQVTDLSDTETIKFKVRYADQYNSVFTIVRWWVTQDAASCLKYLRLSTSDDKANRKSAVDKYQQIKAKYQQAKQQEREESGSKQAKDKAKADISIPANASEAYSLLHNRLLSVLRTTQTIDSAIADTDAYPALMVYADDMLNMVKEIAAELLAADDSEDVEAAEAAEADRVARAAEAS